MTTDTKELRFKVGIVGPSRVGKTSLITAILEQGKHALAGTPASLRAKGQTAGKIEEHKDELYGAIAAGEFNSGALKGDEDRFVFDLDLTVGKHSLRIDLLDYPGGWLAETTRASDMEQEWLECQSFIEQSSVLLMPVDASVVMEATLNREKQAVPRILRTTAVEEVVRLWSKARHDARQKHGEPGLLIVAPIKCETYLADNGGRSDRAEALRLAVREYYHNTLQAAVAEAPETTVLYAPVDTYGCVELKHATFRLDQQPTPEFSARYRFRDAKPVIRPMGADVILGVICGQIIEAAVSQGEAVADELDAAARRAQARTKPDGFLQGIKWFFTGETTRRRTAAHEARGRHAEQQRVVEQLSDAVNVLAQCQPNGRSFWWRRDGSNR